MHNFNKIKLLCLLCTTFVGSGHADPSTFTWPEPTAPYKETDPFIPSTESNSQLDDIKESDHSIEEEENDYLNLEENKDFEDMGKSSSELPTEQDPLLRTPLENKTLRDPILDQDLIDDEDNAVDPVLPQMI